MMNFAEFKDAVKCNIGRFLSEEYENADITFTMVNKADDKSYEALLIKKADKSSLNVVPALNLSEAYQEYKASGKTIDQICEKLASVRMNAPAPKTLEISDMLSSFENVKDRVFPKVVNRPRNIDYLKTRPHVDLTADISMIYAVRVSADAFNVASFVVDNDLMSQWKVDVSTLHEAAMRNLEAEFPLIKELAPGTPFLILTNQRGVFGATLMFCSKWMDDLVEHFGTLYVLPVSVHETIIVPKVKVLASDMKVQDLADIVCESNGALENQKEMLLSDHVYEYSAETHSIQLVDVVKEEVSA